MTRNKGDSVHQLHFYVCAYYQAKATNKTKLIETFSKVEFKIDINLISFK